MRTPPRPRIPLHWAFVILAGAYATVGLLVGRSVGKSVATGLFFATLVTAWFAFRRWWSSTHPRRGGDRDAGAPRP